MSAGYTINPYALLLLQARVGQGQSLAEQSVQVTLKPARCSFAVAELYKYKRELDEVHRIQLGHMRAGYTINSPGILVAVAELCKRDLGEDIDYSTCVHVPL